MFDWIRNLRKKPAAPLAGAPEVRRLKTYSAQSGYVYQYFFEGYRPASRGGEQCTAFVFQVTADRSSYFAASVFVPEPAVESWQRDRGRELNSTERYAVAKMALFQAFDERANPMEMRRDVEVRRADIDGIVETLGLE